MSRRYPNRPLRILIITNAMILVAGAMLGPIYAIFIKNIGGDLLEASFASGLFAIVAGIVVLIMGKLVDKVVEQELIVVLGYVLIGVGFLLYIICESIWFLLLIQILIGFGEAIYSPAFDVIYSKHIIRRTAGEEWSKWEAIDYFASAFGAIAGGFIVKTFGFNMLFIIMAFTSLLSALYIYKLPREIL